MKKILVPSLIIALLAIIAAGTGLFWQDGGQSFDVTNVYGQNITLYGNGLYRNDSVSSVAQAKAQDMLTLFIAVPLLLAGVYTTWKKSLRGQLLLTGMLGYFLYTYASAAFGFTYNPFFLIYVALFSLSLFAFIFAMRAIDVDAVNARITTGFPRTGLAVLNIIAGLFLLMAWAGGRVIGSMLAGTVPAGLDNYSTLFIQVLDLGVVMPASFLTAGLLLKRDRWGVPLATVFVIKTATLGAAVSLMAFNMLRSGMPISLPELLIFPLITLGVIYYAVRLFAGLRNPAAAQ